MVACCTERAKLPDSSFSVTSFESSSFTAASSIWYISPASSSSSRSVALTSFNLHPDAKWFRSPHFRHSWPIAGQDFNFSAC